ncbi:MAG: glycosyltransferase family 2 protein [Pseudomonadota bacterium]
MKVAVILPCYNEGPAIYQVVRSFKENLPEATVYVFDNASTDNTAEEALRAGATVHRVNRQGKGNVVRRMFADIEADCYLMADGDETYDASYARKLIDCLVNEKLDMVVGTREPVNKELAYRPGHVFGNKLLTGIVRFIFGTGFTDMLSGYRVFSRRFVKTFPAFSEGFEIETELTIHALRLGLPYAEVPTPYYERGEGSNSKLSTFKDGFRILWFIFILFKEHKPFPFFGILAIVLASLSVILATPLLMEFIATGLVPRLPTAILSTGLMISAVLSFITGVILDSLSLGRRENLQLQYLQYTPVHSDQKSTEG